MPDDDNNPGSRKLWHAMIDRAVSLARQRGEAVTAEAVLDSCGLFKWAPYRDQALTYANKMMTTANKAVTAKENPPCHSSKPKP